MRWAPLGDVVAIVIVPRSGCDGNGPPVLWRAASGGSTRCFEWKYSLLRVEVDVASSRIRRCFEWNEVWFGAESQHRRGGMRVRVMPFGRLSIALPVFLVGHMSHDAANDEHQREKEQEVVVGKADKIKHDEQQHAGIDQVYVKPAAAFRPKGLQHSDQLLHCTCKSTKNYAWLSQNIC